MTDDKEDRIRRRAYELWEEDGRPGEQHLHHWDRAAREVEEEHSSLLQTTIPQVGTEQPPDTGAAPGSTLPGTKAKKPRVPKS